MTLDIKIAFSIVTFIDIRIHDCDANIFTVENDTTKKVDAAAVSTSSSWYRGNFNRG